MTCKDERHQKQKGKEKLEEKWEILKIPKLPHSEMVISMSLLEDYHPKVIRLHIFPIGNGSRATTTRKFPDLFAHFENVKDLRYNF